MCAAAARQHSVPALLHFQPFRALSFLPCRPRRLRGSCWRAWHSCTSCSWCTPTSSRVGGNIIGLPKVVSLRLPIDFVHAQLPLLHTDLKPGGLRDRTSPQQLFCAGGTSMLPWLPHFATTCPAQPPTNSLSCLHLAAFGCPWCCREHPGAEQRGVQGPTPQRQVSSDVRQGRFALAQQGCSCLQLRLHACCHAA